MPDGKGAAATVPSASPPAQPKPPLSLLQTGFLNLRELEDSGFGVCPDRMPRSIPGLCSLHAGGSPFPNGHNQT